MHDILVMIEIEKNTVKSNFNAGHYETDGEVLLVHPIKFEVFIIIIIIFFWNFDSMIIIIIVIIHSFSIFILQSWTQINNINNKLIKFMLSEWDIFAVLV